MADPSDDLDQLLDSALDDFAKIDLGPSKRSNSEESLKGDDGPSSDRKPAVQGLGLGLPDLKAKGSKKGKQRAASKGNHASEALEQLTRQTREAVRELKESTATMDAQGDDMDPERMVEDFVKQFGDFGGGPPGDMESLVETMFQQLLSKEILHEPMKEIEVKYPQWLEAHKDGLNQEDYDRYSHQYELIKNLNEVYEQDPDNFPKIVDLMQKMQECGQPPSDIVRELAPDLDLSNLGLLSPETAESPANCCIM